VVLILVNTCLLILMVQVVSLLHLSLEEVLIPDNMTSGSYNMIAQTVMLVDPLDAFSILLQIKALWPVSTILLDKLLLILLQLQAIHIYQIRIMKCAGDVVKANAPCVSSHR